MDTRNFDINENRFNHRDVSVYKELTRNYYYTHNKQQRARIEPAGEAGPKKWFEALREALHDTRGLTAMDLLKLDYKQRETPGGLKVGLAEISDDMAGWIERAGGPANLARDVGAFFAAQRLDLLICKGRQQKGLDMVGMGTTAGAGGLSISLPLPGSKSNDGIVRTKSKAPLLQAVIIASRSRALLSGTEACLR